MKHRLYIVLLLLSGCFLPTWAADASLSGLHCGQMVRLTATPDPGYRFVSWSDGVTDNPRLVEVGETDMFQAIYEEVCMPIAVIPVDELYGQLLVVDRAALRSMGYDLEEAQLLWYRIVGEPDELLSPFRDDVYEATGFYINRSAVPSGQYYVEARLDEASDCPEVLRSAVWDVYATGIPDVPSEAPEPHKFIYADKLFIRCGQHIYDATGKLVR